MLYEFTSLRRTAEPAGAAVSLADAKAHLRVATTDDDTLIGAYTLAAEAYVEDVCRRALVEQEWTLTLDAFPVGPIFLPRPPVATVDSITYVDADGAEQTLAAESYTADTSSEPAAVVPVYGESWPTTREQRGAVTVVYTAGVAASEDTDVSAAIPAAIKQAILLMVGHFYENREAVNVGNIVTQFPMAVEALLSPHRVLEI